MRAARALLVGIATVCAAQTTQTLSQAPAQGSSTAQTPADVSFQFERVGLPVPRYTLTVHEDGSGSYKGETAPIAGSPGSAPSAGQKIDRPVKLSAATTETIFKTARLLDYFNIECESKAKNIANTGKKTLSYTGADGHGSCLYNYSENKSVEQLTDLFQAIAFTLDEGRRLDFLRRFDRLGLYSEMDILNRELEAKRALELGNIRGSLTAIAGDESLMERVRDRAIKLLGTISEAK